MHNSRVITLGKWKYETETSWLGQKSLSATLHQISPKPRRASDSKRATRQHHMTTLSLLQDGGVWCDCLFCEDVTMRRVTTTSVSRRKRGLRTHSTLVNTPSRSKAHIVGFVTPIYSGQPTRFHRLCIATRAQRILPRTWHAAATDQGSATSLHRSGNVQVNK